MGEYGRHGLRRWTGVQRSGHRTRPAGVAVRGGRIAAVGPDDELRDLVGTATEVVDLAGGLLHPRVPGRPRPPRHGRRRPAAVRPPRRDVAPRRASPRSLTYAAGNPDLEWIVGGGWWMSHYADGTPTREALDAVVPDRPVFLTNKDGHGTWVNSRGARARGDRRLDARPGGRSHRAPAGRLAQRHPARRGGAARRPAAARRHCGAAGRRAPDGPGDDVLPRHHVVAGRGRGRALRHEGRAAAPISRQPPTVCCGRAWSGRCGGTASVVPSRSPSCSSAGRTARSADSAPAA